MHVDVYNGRNTVVGCCCILFAVPCVRCHTTHTRLTALYPGLPGRAGTRKVKPIWIFLKQETVSGPYASLHLAPDR